jgi:hypothetical protein
LLSAAAVLITAVTETATAKSLYVIADIVGKPTPVHAYDVGADGTLIFQALDKVPRYSFGAVGMAIDEDSAYLFITYEDSDNIQLVNAMTMIETSTVIAPGAINLAGIAYDHGKGLLYCVDRGTEKIYVYDWDPEATTLTNVTDSATLTGASAYGIALDEVNGLLYVANYSDTVKVYHTSDWSLARTISLSRLAVSIAIDVQRGFLYLGGGYVEDEDFVTRYNPYLTQYDLATGTEAAVKVDPDAGVIGLSVDITTGNVYTTTGRNNVEGGDNLLVYDTALNRIDVITGLGNPTGLIVPAKDIGYNPLNLKKEIIEGAIGETGVDNIKLVGIGRDFTYGIYFDNSDEDLTLTDVCIVDTLPEQVSFVTANDDGANGHYDPNTHTYTWLYSSVPPQSAARLELVAHVNEDTAPGTTIRNYVTVDSNETSTVTKRHQRRQDLMLFHIMLPSI